ncbi:transcriptional regulator, TetR family [Parasphingorhabdus marina DSM 22363]|uniref:Transcriptional regulator, TetR family n=1 Tax=Parasphingorhabdus marina DSM 22363 TaxID=1123272 RepID=A0A1N6CTC0_9SPHN|nr:TetR/AcrR family transcriptional regulator [Parasphingorhabdus marina]SIN61717.1 transcriptional regulator, TetR family [Parasphingorhabdus marina DSM 22363]
MQHLSCDRQNCRRQKISNTREQILDIAETGYRQGGFDGLSFRDIADELGIKSASVHYHFRHKEDLGSAVVQRYAEELLARLGEPDNPAETSGDRLERLINAYKAAYAEGKSSCLCAVLGSVNPHLPPAVQKAIRQFFSRLLLWAEQGKIRNPAQIVSALQGAMILSVATGDAGHLDRVAQDLAGAT